MPAQRLPRDRRTQEAIRLLIELGADRTAHSRERSLLGHLVGTAQLLLAWDMPIDTLRAGLCHSIYGTNAFRKVSLPPGERASLQRIIGKRAEALVWQFATLRRPATLQRAIARQSTLVTGRNGRTRSIDTAHLRQLYAIECANLLDQGIEIRRVCKLLRTAETLDTIPSRMLNDMRSQHRRARIARLTS